MTCEYGISIYFTPIQSIPLQHGEMNQLSLKENCFLLAYGLWPLLHKKFNLIASSRTEHAGISCSVRIGKPRLNKMPFFFFASNLEKGKDGFIVNLNNQTDY